MKVKIIPLRNLLINGAHCAALTEVEVDEATGRALLAQRLAAEPLSPTGAPKPLGLARAKIETAARPPPPLAEVAVSATAQPATSAPTAPNPKPVPQRPRRRAQ